MSLLIVSHGHASTACEQDDLPSLKEQVRAATGENVRRVSRFIQQALIGAGQCLQQHAAPPDTAVYLTSGRGDLGVTLEVLVQMIEHGQPPKPLSFINTVSNAACYYIAQQFGLHGRSVCVTRRYAPLESVLALAKLDLVTGQVPAALVGAVDICTTPLAEHRKRLRLPADHPVGEGSHWFLLAPASAATTALARIEAVTYLPDFAALEQDLTHTPPHTGVLAAGQHLPVDIAEHLHRITGLAPWQPNEPPPWYDCHAGHTLGCFLQQKPAARLLHIDSDTAGGFNLMRVSLPC